MPKDIIYAPAPTTPSYLLGALPELPETVAAVPSSVHIQPLYLEHRDEVLAFLRTLNSVSRQARFWSPLGDYGLMSHVDRFDFRKAQMLGLYIDAQLVGTAEIIHDAGVAEIALVLSEAVRGQGLGRALLQAAVCLARERGAGKVYLLTATDNRAMQHTARSACFTRTSLHEGEWYAERDLPEEDTHFPSVLAFDVPQ
jgi:RimJ/RimL family protein N-acetyltransferase